MANIKILVGTVYGNALDVGQMCEAQLRDCGHEVVLLRQPDISDVLVDDLELLLVCTSTTGQGEIPDSLLKLYCQLQDRLPQLPQVRYGLIALGDSGYDTFAEAGKLMAALLDEMQLQRVGEPLVIDACECMDPLEEAEPWIIRWNDLLQETA